MSQFDSLGGSQPQDPQPPDGDREPQESFAPPASDWSDAPREVLRGLAEEAQHDVENDSHSIDPIAPSDPPITAQRQRPPQQRRSARERPSRPAFTLEQRLLILDAWCRSGLAGTEFAPLVGVAPHTLYCWRRAFEQDGPAGLVQKPRGAPTGSRLPEVTKRTILLMKQHHPDWGCQRISDMLLRGPALGASASAVAHVLHEAGYELEELPTKPHPPQVHRFERARPNQLWQTDLFTFILKRQNRRVYLVAFLDDHSRFITSFGLHASQSSALVIEVLRAGIASYGLPQEILNDNGSQYVTWRGKSAFSRELDKLGIRQVVAARKHPQTLGKIERFWGTLWRECLEGAIFQDLGAASEVLRTLRARVAANALELARRGVPKAPFYLTGQLDGKGFSIHAAGDRVILIDATGAQRDIELVAPRGANPTGTTQTPACANASATHPEQNPSLPEPICPDGSPRELLPPSDDADPIPPGSSPLDLALDRLDQGLVDRAAPGDHTWGPSRPETSPDPSADDGGVR